jgi:hypothetical protein
MRAEGLLQKSCDYETENSGDAVFSGRDAFPYRWFEVCFDKWRLCRNSDKFGEHSTLLYSGYCVVQEEDFQIVCADPNLGNCNS